MDYFTLIPNMVPVKLKQISNGVIVLVPTKRGLCDLVGEISVVISPVVLSDHLNCQI